MRSGRVLCGPGGFQGVSEIWAVHEGKASLPTEIAYALIVRPGGRILQDGVGKLLSTPESVFAGCDHYVSLSYAICHVVVANHIKVGYAGGRVPGPCDVGVHVATEALRRRNGGDGGLGGGVGGGVKGNQRRSCID